VFRVVEIQLVGHRKAPKVTVQTVAHEAAGSIARSENL
jgi:hypothetical protein